MKEVFLKNVSLEKDKVVRVELFDTKTSVLDFFGKINNYQARLKKYFRGYEEIISYSDKYFYNGDLQIMRVRGVPVSSVIRFTQVKHGGFKEAIKNTNMPEIDFIISELKTLKEQDKKYTVGIITPYENQQRLLFEKISGLPEEDYFFETLKLKIMTFDTCQGEEMDIVFYSMVATEADDKLNYFFISDLNNTGVDDGDGSLKAKRLNVGLSLAKERMHFVLSKPVDKYNGSVKEFLQHYTGVLLDAQKELDATSVDNNSKMDSLVLEWIKQTKFWKENNGATEIFTQFDSGKYLKQIDGSYEHPNYRVDFLLVYNGNDGVQYKVIIEYEELLEHLGEYVEDGNSVTDKEYYSPEDVYRQNVLESYGCRFIRISRFNLGENPIATLDSLIHMAVKKPLPPQSC